MVEQVEKRNKSGNIKPLTRQQLINIVSNSWSEVPKEIVIKGFELTGGDGEDHLAFMRHQAETKKLLLV